MMRGRSGVQYATDANGIAIGFVGPSGNLTYNRLQPISGCPMIVPPGNGASAGIQFDATLGNGTFAIVGAVAMPATFLNCFMYFPANQIAGTSNAAGFYYVTMTSTTAGRVWNNCYVSGASTIPTTLVAFAGVTNSAWLTQTTGANLVAFSTTVAGNSIGTNGSWRLSTLGAWNNSGGNKINTVNFGGVALNSFTRSTTTNDDYSITFRNLGSYAVNVHSVNVAPAAAVIAAYTTINTAVDQTLTYTLQLAANIDFVALMPPALEIFFQ